MNNVTFLRKIPKNPVVFSYNSDNDSTPVVLVLKLLHEEDNPGFLGINLSYVEPINRRKVIETFLMHSNPEDASFAVMHLVQKAIRRYNYSKIGFFIYRGNKQDHKLILTNANYD